MARPPSRPGWWRIPAPSLLVFIVILGLLPWIEIGCEGKPEAFKTGMLKVGDKNIGQNGTFVYATQNGYQTIWGGFSFGPEIREEIRKAEKEAEKFTKDLKVKVDPETLKKAKEEQRKKQKEEEPASSPLMAIFFVLVIAAIAVGFAMPPSLWRTIAFGATTTLATLILVIQILIGFPSHDKFEEQAKKKKQELGGGVEANKELKDFCRFTPWFYMTWPFLILPLGLIGVEELLSPKSGGVRRRPKRRFVDDDDDDDRPRPRRRVVDDDEDDDRPRARRRPIDDDDDDDRPRRRRRLSDDDDEPPRKKSPSDDRARITRRPPLRKKPAEEEDDRPRRRVRRPDDDD
jgi:hypothetical protein